MSIFQDITSAFFNRGSMEPKGSANGM